MAVFFFLLLTVIRVEATPINPDIRKVLARPDYQANQFAPARAGWDGPEMSTSRPVNLTLEQVGPAATARELHAALFAAFVPDYRVVALIVLIILFFRRVSLSRSPQPARTNKPTIIPRPAAEPAQSSLSEPPRAA